MTATAYYTTAGISTAVMTASTAIQPDQVLQWISLGITILAAIISFIVLPVLDWVKKRKESDEKTTVDDVKDLVEDIKDGLEKVKDEINGKEESNDGTTTKGEDD